MLWQRWIRYLALGAAAAVFIAFSSMKSSAIAPIAIISIAYVAIVMGTTHVLRRSRGGGSAWVPALLMAADTAALAGFVYFTSAPEHQPRILLVGFLLVQLGVFYFGRGHGSVAAALTALSYVVVALVLPPYVDGPRPSISAVAFNVTLYATISAAMVHAFGSFHERIDALRAYCKVVEQGEAALPRLGEERWPDDLTLLARSFQAMHVRLAEQVGSDPLTGCMNRRALETALRTDLRQARRRGSAVAVVAIDVDHFKEVNDSRGHPVGDVVLQQVASIMKTTARDTDSVARFGGDEFVVVLPDTGWQGALMFAERLRHSVDEFTFGPPDAPLDLTISLGVALARSTDATSAELLLKEADAALYKAKTAGRNRVFS
jgi:diguanylate cyclase (GGDEF)-like protein